MKASSPIWMRLLIFSPKIFEKSFFQGKKNTFGPNIRNVKIENWKWFLAATVLGQSSKFHRRRARSKSELILFWLTKLPTGRVLKSTEIVNTLSWVIDWNKNESVG